MEPVAASELPRGDGEESEQDGEGFHDKEMEYATAIRKHYLRNSLFYFVGCFCAMICDSYLYCLILIFVVLVERCIEIYAVYYEKLWLSYICHTLSCVINYINIISAIAYSVE